MKTQTDPTTRAVGARQRPTTNDQQPKAIAFALALALAACTSKPVSTEPTVTVTPTGPALPVDHPRVDILTSRQTDRVSVSQLRGMLPVIFGDDVNGKP